MNGVEAAASLFGSEEPASDPFAALGEPQPSHEDPFLANGASYPLHSGATAEHSSSTNVGGTAASPAFPEHSQQGQHSQNSSYPAASYAPDLGGGTSQQGWYGESAYDIPEPTSTEHGSYPNDATSTSSIQDPYVPPPELVTTSNDSQLGYGDYALPQPGPGFNPLTDYSSPSYSYTSSSQPPDSQYNPSYPASSQSSYLQQNVDSKSSVPLSVPPPAPAPVEPINRPKVSNAYDPPFPTLTKSRRSAASRVGLNQTHNSYQSHLPPATAEPFAPPPPPQAPQVQPTEWGYSSYDNMSHGDATISGFGGPPQADPKFVAGIHRQSNSYAKPLDVGPSTVTSSKRIETHVRDYATSIPPAAIHARDLYQASPPPTKTRSRASSPLVHLPIDARSSPRNPLSPPSPLSGHSFAYGRGTPPAQVATEPTDSNPFVAEHMREGFSASSYSHNTEQTTMSVDPIPFESASTNGFQDQQTDLNDMFPTTDEATASYLNGPSYDPYAPKSYVNGSYTERTSSPSSIRSWAGAPAKSHPSVDQHSPSPPRADILRSRSMSNGPSVSPRSTSARDPYVPSQHTRRQKSETDYGIYGYQHGREHTQNYPSSILIDHPPMQEGPVKPFQTPYAPSPSLLGANDPLGRTAARIPVFSFGFGGKVATCFHGAALLNTGFDVALSSRNSTGVHIRVLKQIIPQSALDTSTVAFPGPLFSDPGSSTSLVRTGSTSQTKTKKAQVAKYLDERTDEIALGLRYLNSGSMERWRAEGKLVLIKLLKVLVEHDGRLTGTPQLDMAVRVALLPHLEGSDDINGVLGTTFPTPVDPQTSIVDLSSAPYPVLSGAPTSQESPISVITLRPSFLDKIQNFLLRGERREAYLYALDKKLWAHAMVIASSIDKEAWKEVVNDFLKNELSPKDPAASTDKFTNDRECLRVAYSLFSGQGAASVQELVPPTALSITGPPHPQVASQMTPRTPNFGLPPATAPIPVETISKWADTVAMMLSNPLPQETSAALTSLGDQLAANQLYEAAHVCYLLAPQTSPMGGLGNVSARVVLVGSQSPQTLPNFAKDPDPFIFSEVVEFALSLAAPTRGQDPYQGIPHLQPYRFVRAMALAEIGDLQLASRYCEAITAAVGRSSSPYFTPALLDHLKGFSDRIVGVAQVDKSGSWMGAKLSKPSLDTIGGWLEGRFTKLVTGDAETPTAGDDEGRAEDRSFSGPFSHYSTISSATPSARSSPQPSLVNVLPPARSGSAMASSTYHPPIDRASSAMDYTKPKASPTPRVSSANPATTAFAYAASFGQPLSNLGTPNVYNNSVDLVTPRPAEHGDDDIKKDGSWWGSSAYDENPTPTASTFLAVDGNKLASTNGFISLMDNDPYSPAPHSPSRAAPAAPTALDDDEDLGFGNSKREVSKDMKEEHQGNSPPHTSQAEKSETPESTPAPGGSWISRWWKRSDSTTPGPTKASLGEESAFYYDKDLKRWVNKKASSEPTKPTHAPPPSRAHTASPGMSSMRHLGPPSDTRPPPARPASAIDLSTSPPSKTLLRMRSNLAPLPESAPGTPIGSRSSVPGPPPGRPISQASKRSVRSRYVDVFQQEAGA